LELEIHASHPGLGGRRILPLKANVGDGCGLLNERERMSCTGDFRALCALRGSAKVRHFAVSSAHKSGDFCALEQPVEG
jgi:hypothetical protein